MKYDQGVRDQCSACMQWQTLRFIHFMEFSIFRQDSKKKFSSLEQFRKRSLVFLFCYDSFLLLTC